MFIDIDIGLAPPRRRPLRPATVACPTSRRSKPPPGDLLVDVNRASPVEAHRCWWRDAGRLAVERTAPRRGGRRRPGGRFTEMVGQHCDRHGWGLDTPDPLTAGSKCPGTWSSTYGHVVTVIEATSRPPASPTCAKRSPAMSTTLSARPYVPLVSTWHGFHPKPSQFQPKSNPFQPGPTPGGSRHHDPTNIRPWRPDRPPSPDPDSLAYLSDLLDVDARSDADRLDPRRLTSRTPTCCGCRRRQTFRRGRPSSSTTCFSRRCHSSSTAARRR